MLFICFVLNLTIALVVSRIVVRDYYSDRVPLFSCRNVYLFGFLFFQNFGVNVWLFFRRSVPLWAYRVRDSDHWTTLHYIALQLLSVVCVFLAYNLATIAFVRRREDKREMLSQQSCLIYATALVAMATVFWVVGLFVLKDLMTFVASGVGATATGFAAVAWFRDRQNPFLLGILVGVTLVACLPHLTEYGRRGLLSIAMVIAWVGYRNIFHRISVIKAFAVFLVITSPMVLLLAAFSEARVRRPKTVAQSIEYMLEADIVHGLSRLGTFQGSAIISMWCMENFPRPYGYRHLHTLRATVHYFIPRAFWKEKPEGLGIQIPGMARLRNVGGLNVGAGLIGHAMAEGGIYAIVIYSVLIGYGLKFMDVYVETRSHFAYSIPMLSGLGQLFAVPRGEVNFFIDVMLIGIVSSFICIRSLDIIMPSLTRRRGHLSGDGFNDAL